MASTRFARGALIAALPFAFGDGRGMIGYGITMYQPPCTFACRGVIAKCPLTCTPHTEGSHGSGHSASPTPPECFASDQAFMRTLAMCIYTYCPSNGNPQLSVIEEYWATHLASGSIGTNKYPPAATYQEVLEAAKKEDSAGGGNATASNGHAGHQRRIALKTRHGGPDMDMEPDKTVYSTSLPIIRSGMPLNVTSYVREKDWLKQYNGLTSFEINETGHVTYTLIITIVALFLPLAASVFSRIPALNRSKSWAWLNSVVVYPPLWGSKHREPAAKAIGGGFVPTRGQSWYIMTIVLLNMMFLIAPYYTIQPQSIFPTLHKQEVSTIGNRAGVMAMGNIVALTVFAGRNNPLLNLTGINYDTYLLFHRVLGYLAIFHTVLHSIMLLAYYKVFGGYEAEVVKPYWIWGVLATVAAVVLWPASVLAVRKRFYEVFLSVHHLLVVLFLVGYFYHIIDRYSFKWGYEVWCYAAGAIWGVERLLRLARIGLAGWKTATVTEISGSGGEYLRIDIDGVHARGLVYLYFPTLSWRFWENHPFSVASSFSTAQSRMSSVKNTAGSCSDSEKAPFKETVKSETDVSSTSGATEGKQRVTIVLRTQSGMTQRLAARLAAAAPTLRIPVLVEGSYQTSHASQLSQCTSLICIAGGVGVSAVLPLLHEHSGRRRLYWGMRNSSLLEAFSADLAGLSSLVAINTSVGSRIDIAAALRDELTCRTEDRGAAGVVVCGPGQMADTVRQEVAKLAKSGAITRGIVLMDETFTW